MLLSRAQKYGVQVIIVEPEYTSIIGIANWSEKLGIGRDPSAGIAIGRRALGYSESFSGQGTSGAPVRKRHEHVWSYWKRYSKYLKAKKTKDLKKSESSEKKRKEQSSEDAMRRGRPRRQWPERMQETAQAPPLSDMPILGSQVISASADISCGENKGQGNVVYRSETDSVPSLTEQLPLAHGSAAGIRAAGWEHRSPNKSSERLTSSGTGGINHKKCNM